MFSTRLLLRHCLCATSVALLAAQHDDEAAFARQQNAADVKSREAIRKCGRIVKQKLVEIGAPGIVVGVAVDGRTVWSKGFGYADIENSVPCVSETVMRIGSVSKSLTMAAVAKLVESGKLDLDKPVTEYVSEFPTKFHNDKKVDITTRMLLSHKSGIRHYQTLEEKKKALEFENKEYYSVKEYKNVIEALEMFKNDKLFHEPGKKFLYTTHGWTLVSAVVERASGEDFLLHMKKLFADLGMKSTVAETQTEIVYHRARHYVRNEKGRLVNTPYVNNSYKWAGGGFLSNVIDLLKFGNIMLCCHQSSDSNSRTPAFLKSQTVTDMWSPVIKPEHKSSAVVDNEMYALGWYVYPPKSGYAGAGQCDLEVAHTGGAIGGSSILYILPLGDVGSMTQASKKSEGGSHSVALAEHGVSSTLTHGVVVAILTNLQSVNLTELARVIACEFRKVL